MSVLIDFEMMVSRWTQKRCSSCGGVPPFCCHVHWRLEGISRQVAETYEIELTAQAERIAALETELRATSAVLETYFPGRQPTAPHDLAFLLGEKVAALEAEAGRLKELLERVRCAEAPEEYLDDIEAILEGRTVPDPLAPFLALAVAAREFWSECWDVSLPTVKKFQAALVHPAVQRAVKETK